MQVADPMQTDGDRRRRELKRVPVVDDRKLVDIVSHADRSARLGRRAGVKPSE
jgi:CBS domain-containing protein